MATTFWQRIVKEAREQLQLADVDGVHRLRVGEAKLLSVSVDAVRARRILEATEFRQRLLHHTVDDDKEARKALNELGCARIGDDDLLQAISNHALYKASDHEWLWTCWEWLAAWVAEKERYYTERR